MKIYWHLNFDSAWCVSTLQLWKIHVILSLDIWKQFVAKHSINTSSFVKVWALCVCKKMLHKKSQHTWAPGECRHYWAWWTLWAKRLPQPEDTPSSQSHWTQTWPHTSSRGWPGLLSSVSPASWGLHWLDSRPRLLGRWSRSNQCLMKSWLKTGKWWKKKKLIVWTTCSCDASYNMAQLMVLRLLFPSEEEMAVASLWCHHMICQSFPRGRAHNFPKHK